MGDNEILTLRNENEKLLYKIRKLKMTLLDYKDRIKIVNKQKEDVFKKQICNLRPTLKLVIENSHI